MPSDRAQALLLAMDILACGPLTGASIYPARTFGPALAKGDLSYFWTYLVGTFIGGAASGLLCDKYFMAPVQTSTS